MLGKRARDVALTIGTALGSAAVLYVFYPATVAAMVVTVLLVHELGHYYSALLRGGTPVPPFLIPFGIGAVGITRVRNLPNLPARTKRYLILAGPVGGAVCALSLLPYALLAGSTSLLWVVAALLFWEFYGATLGADGKRWRKEAV